MSLTVIMPIAGAGSRFAAHGEMRPKPLIEIAGIPMAIWALRSILKSWPDARVVFVVLREHETTWQISSKLLKLHPNGTFCFVESLTSGSLQTSLTAESAFDGKDLRRRLIVLDCDLIFQSDEFVQYVNALSQPDEIFAAVLLSFTSQDPRYSYARIENGAVTETAEKMVISDNALVGAYAFKEARSFFEAAKHIVLTNNKVANGEFYTSTVFNDLIKADKKVALAKVTDFWSFGTPEELSGCLQNVEFRSALKNYA